MVRLVLFDREAGDINARVLKILLGRIIVEEVKKPGTSKNLLSISFNGTLHRMIDRKGD